MNIGTPVIVRRGTYTATGKIVGCGSVRSALGPIPLLYSVQLTEGPLLSCLPREVEEYEPLTRETDMTDMTVKELQQRLARCHRAMGSVGRLSFDISQGDEERCYVIHWVRSGPSAFEDCKAVGVGTAEECLEALESYAARFRPRPTDEDVARMIGLLPEPCAQPLAAE